VDGAIRRVAGPTLFKELSQFSGCAPGEAVFTGGHMLPARYIIHTVGPRKLQKNVLQRAYKNILELVRRKNIKTVALPCISSGDFGKPNKEDAEVALQSIRDWLEDYACEVDRVIFCLKDPQNFSIYNTLMPAFFPKDFVDRRPSKRICLDKIQSI
uniref:Macro domain-containing protein n=3 Tax=Clytia hemisphaerica TaxID=252671 RepID=A0A7M6DPC8_9CNID